MRKLSLMAFGILACLPMRLKNRQGSQPPGSRLLPAADVSPAAVWLHSKRPFTGIHSRRKEARGSVSSPGYSACEITL